MAKREYVEQDELKMKLEQLEILSRMITNFQKSLLK